MLADLVCPKELKTTVIFTMFIITDIIQVRTINVSPSIWRCIFLVRQADRRAVQAQSSIHIGR